MHRGSSIFLALLAGMGFFACASWYAVQDARTERGRIVAEAQARAQAHAAHVAADLARDLSHAQMLLAQLPETLGNQPANDAEGGADRALAVFLQEISMHFSVMQFSRLRNFYVVGEEGVILYSMVPTRQPCADLARIDPDDGGDEGETRLLACPETWDADRHDGQPAVLVWRTVRMDNTLAGRGGTRGVAVAELQLAPMGVHAGSVLGPELSFAALFKAGGASLSQQNRVPSRTGGVLYAVWQAAPVLPSVLLRDVYPFSRIPREFLELGGATVTDVETHVIAVMPVEGVWPVHFAAAYPLESLLAGWERNRINALWIAALLSVVTGGCLLLVVQLSRRRMEAVEALRGSELFARQMQMLRETVVQAGERETVDEVVAVFLKNASGFVQAPVVVVALFGLSPSCPVGVHGDRRQDGGGTAGVPAAPDLCTVSVTMEKRSRPDIHWHLEGGQTYDPLRAGIEHALHTEYVRTLAEPLRMPDVAAYPLVFGGDREVERLVGRGCFVPFVEPDNRLVFGAFFARNDNSAAEAYDDEALETLFEQAAFALSRIISHKRMEEALHVQESLYRGMFENVGFAKLLADPQTGDILDANIAAVEFFGHDRSALLNMSLWDLHVAGEAAVRALYRRALRTCGHVLETRQRTADGQEKDVEVHAAPIEMDGSTRLFLSLYDVTRRKQVEAALARSEQHLRSIVEKAPVALSICDATGRFVYVNPAFAALFGYAPQEMPGTAFSLLFRDEDLSEFTRFLHLFLQEGEDASREWTMRRKDDELRTVLVHCSLMSSAEGLPQIVSFALDITERQRMEDMMVQSEKMASVGGLAAGMAHEINNPLGGILQGYQNVHRRLDPELPANRTAAEQVGVSLDDVRKYLEERGILRFLSGIRECAERAARITSNMLDFSRRGESVYLAARLDELLDRALDLAMADYDLNKRYDFKSVTIVREYAEDMPPVHCVRTEIEQVALNLFKNAAQAMGDASPPIENPVITVRTMVQDDMAVFEVEDNGPGMPKTVARRVFEPFFTTKRAGEGTGLGLSVSYFIITNNHRGSVSLDTVPGRGTRFTIRLPYQRNA
ncbi:PAS domain-containing sensor histidine kinase [Desulfovibrio psychrotolerans]|uniref:histidine kinase n=1 Tax=Desulfovibrio psychrotolerans TaxID=415242 RepID=A0A7J0BUN1_9BACT|nr:PAS domain S-box protein [Desulfovibrio psychrotolerans]GFM36714.1 hypothetical protein DSM19430T_13980 [Desulfovibrio psychrotolerans]